MSDVASPTHVPTADASSSSSPSPSNGSNDRVVEAQRVMRAVAATFVRMAQEAEKVNAGKSVSVSEEKTNAEDADDHDANGWKLIEMSNGVKIMEMDPTSKLAQSVNASGTLSDHLAAFAGQGIIDAPLIFVLELLMDTQQKSNYDSIFDKAILLEHITDHIKVEHHLYWAPPFVGKRDFVVQLHKSKLSDGSILLLAKSVTHPNCPEAQKYVRGEIHMGGWLLTPLPPIDSPSTAASPTTGRSYVTFVGSSDLKGSIPASIRRRLSVKQPSQIQAIKAPIQHRMKKIKQMKEEERENIIKQLQQIIDALPLYNIEELLKESNV